MNNRAFFGLILGLVLALSIALDGCSSSSGTNSSGVAPQEELYLENKGSDTIVNLALAWAEFYQNEHADVRISVTGGGSVSTGRAVPSIRWMMTVEPMKIAAIVAVNLLIPPTRGPKVSAPAPPKAEPSPPPLPSCIRMMTMRNNAEKVKMT